LTTVRSRFSNLPDFPEVTQLVYGVESNLLDVGFSQYYVPTDVDSRCVIKLRLLTLSLPTNLGLPF
jgi:hypothetical protein